MARAPYSSISVGISHQHDSRPGFVAGVVIATAEDASSFTVECQVDAQTVKIVEVGSGEYRVTAVHVMGFNFVERRKEAGEWHLFAR